MAKHFLLCIFTLFFRLVYANDFPFSTLHQLICICCSDDTCDIACQRHPRSSYSFHHLWLMNYASRVETTLELMD